MRWFRIVAAIVVGVSAHRADAQAVRRSHPWQPEFRLETLVSPNTAVHAMAGANLLTGVYTRFVVLAGGGARHVGTEWRASGQADALVRLHLDPFGAESHALYAAGGGTLLFDDGARTRLRLALSAGVEGGRVGRWMYGAEIGLSGGVRAGVTIRHARISAR